MPRTQNPPGGDAFSRALWRLRADAGLSSEEAARRAGMGQSTLSRYEHGLFVPPADRINVLCDVYSAKPAARRRLLAMAADVTASTRRVVMHRGAVRFQRDIARIEADSGHVATFHPTIVPGLLQTRRYMRMLAGTGLSGDTLDRWIANRLTRQAQMGEAGRRYTQLVTEGALRWCAGTPDIMVEQMEHLAVVGGIRAVRLGVIAAHTPAHVFPMHGFDIYDNRTVIVGTLAATAILDDPSDVKAHVSMLGELERMAVFGDQARELLAQIAADYLELSNRNNAPGGPS